MAVTNPYKSKEYTYTPKAYTGPAGQTVDTNPQQLRGVSDQTRAQNNTYQQGYQPSQSVTDAQTRLAQVQAQKPAGYTSRYGAALDGILEQIQNPQSFKYSFNDDELFKYYADLYTQKGRQASMDAMGQAAGLTGGYGNSYAQQAGNQAYQQYLLNLYDRGTDFMNAAYQRYDADRADRYNQLNALQGADQADYGKYRDTVADWQAELNYYTGRADTEADRDYSRFAADRDYWNQLAQLENQDWWNANQWNEQIRNTDADRAYQYDALNTQNQYNYDAMAVQQAQADRQMAYNYVQQMIAMGQTPSPEMLAAAGLTPEDYAKFLPQVAAAMEEEEIMQKKPKPGTNDQTTDKQYDPNVRAAADTKFSHDGRTADTGSYMGDDGQWTIGNGKLRNVSEVKKKK